MHYVTFRIKETKGWTVRSALHNHPSRIGLRETPDQETWTRLWRSSRRRWNYRKHFNNALGNYTPVFRYMDELEAKFPEAQSQEFPEDWTDPLELYGQYLQELIHPRVDLERERADLQELLNKKGPEYVWQCRLRLVAERVFIRDF